MYTATNHNQYIHSARDSWLPVMYRVINKKIENDNIASIFLEPAEQFTIEPILPGQFNMLYVFGKGEIPISVSSLMEDHPRIIHTIQGVGAISNALCEVKTGSTIGVRGPFGTSWPVKTARHKDVLLIAGGLGLAPLRPVIEEITKKRQDFRKVNALFGTRSPDTIFFHQDIISWQSNTQINFQITVDHSFRSWNGNVGVVTNLIDKADFDPQDCIAMVCGPEIMMRYAIAALLERGVPECSIYLSMERNMKCATGHCGHCQYGPNFICKDGAVFSYDTICKLLIINEL